MEDVCKWCGAPGEWCYDPYLLDVYDEIEEICLCEKCYLDRTYEIM